MNLFQRSAQHRRLPPLGFQPVVGLLWLRPDASMPRVVASVAERHELGVYLAALVCVCVRQCQLGCPGDVLDVMHAGGAGVDRRLFSFAVRTFVSRLREYLRALALPESRQVELARRALSLEQVANPLRDGESIGQTVGHSPDTPLRCEKQDRMSPRLGCAASHSTLWRSLRLAGSAVRLRLRLGSSVCFRSMIASMKTKRPRVCEADSCVRRISPAHSSPIGGRTTFEQSHGMLYTSLIVDVCVIYCTVSDYFRLHACCAALRRGSWRGLWRAPS